MDRYGEKKEGESQEAPHGADVNPRYSQEHDFSALRGENANLIPSKMRPLVEWLQQHFDELNDRGFSLAVHLPETGESSDSLMAINIDRKENPIGALIEFRPATRAIDVILQTPEWDCSSYSSDVDWTVDSVTGILNPVLKRLLQAVEGQDERT